ncbi:MAG: hypothetical protein WAU45_15180 [Blastocatellia bacterium]
MFSLLEGLGISCTVRAAAVVLAAALLISPASQLAADQDQQKKPDAPAVTRKEDGKVPTGKELEKDKKKLEQQKGKSNAPVFTKAEANVELAIVAYGGRKQLDTVRAAIQEEGTIRLATDQGDLIGAYKLRSMRREKSWLDLLRVDLELTPSDAASGGASMPAIKYVVGFNGATVWSAQNNQYVNARPEAEVAFRAQLTREYTALLRYKEDGSKVDYVGPETIVGVDTTALDLTNENGEKTRFWISTGSERKPGTFRILHVEYELKLSEGKPPTRYHIAYYYAPLRVVQNTLVPARRVMTQDGKFVQEILLTNINYSAKLEPEIFQHLEQ